MIFLRRLFAMILVITMVATTGTMAVMRDRDVGAQAMVICTGVGLHTILVDANGERVDPAPICPECNVMTLAAGAPAPLVMLSGRLRQLDQVTTLRSQPYVRRAKGAVNVRAPPVG